MTDWTKWRQIPPLCNVENIIHTYPHRKLWKISYWWFQWKKYLFQLSKNLYGRNLFDTEAKEESKKEAHHVVCFGSGNEGKWRKNKQAWKDQRAIYNRSSHRYLNFSSLNIHCCVNQCVLWLKENPLLLYILTFPSNN